MAIVKFKTVIQKFKKKGEKTGWTYIDIPSALAVRIKKEKKSFRVKGKLDNHRIEKKAIVPMGDGDFILPLNAVIVKAIGKSVGAILEVQLQEDKSELSLDRELEICLSEELEAKRKFYKLPKSHQHYYSNWIASAKTESTKAKRIAATIKAMLLDQDFGSMLRSLRRE